MLLYLLAMLAERWVPCCPSQVLAIGETVEEVNDSGFLGNVPTLTCQLMADDSMLQVTIRPPPPPPLLLPLAHLGHICLAQSVVS